MIASVLVGLRNEGFVDGTAVGVGVWLRFEELWWTVVEEELAVGRLSNEEGCWKLTVEVFLEEEKEVADAKAAEGWRREVRFWWEEVRMEGG